MLMKILKVEEEEDLVGEDIKFEKICKIIYVIIIFMKLIILILIKV
jgi:hypothetical protein